MGEMLRKIDAKTAVMVAVAFLAFVGGVLATVFVRSEAVVTTNDGEPANIVQKETENKEDSYDTTALENRAEKVEKLYTRFDEHVDSRYGSDVTSIDFTEDPEAVAILAEFIVAIDDLDQTIANSPFDDLKISWRGFRESFDKRRAYITAGVSDEEDGSWVLELVGVYLLILSKVQQ